VRIHNVTAEGFEIRQETSDGTPATATTVAWFAVEPGVWEVDGLTLEASSSTVASVAFSADFANTPVVLASMQTEPDAWGNPTIQNLDADGFDLVAPVPVGYLAIESGSARIDPDTGLMSVIDSTELDYEPLPESNGYRGFTDWVGWTIIDTEGNRLEREEALSFYVHNSNEEPQLVDGQSFSVLEGTEGGHILGTVQVEHREPDEFFSIATGDPVANFTIDPVTGLLSLSPGADLEFELAEVHRLGISLASGNQVDVTEVLVNVQDVDERDVAVSKTIDRSGYVQIGESVTITITVTNNGEQAETGVHLTDIGLALDEAFDLAVGETATFAVPVTVTGELRSGAIANLAVADTSPQDNGAGNCTMQSGDLRHPTTNDGRNVNANPTDLVIADFDLDGDQDIVFVGYQMQGPILWLNDGNASFSLASEIIYGGDAATVVVGDLNGDNLNDVVVTERRDNVEIYFGQPGGSFILAQAFEIANGITVDASTLGDVDGDGDLDIYVAAGYQIPDRLLINDGTGTFSLGQALTLSTTREAAFADMDNDGDLDVVVPTSGNEEIWRNDGDGNFSFWYSFNAYNTNYDLGIADFNGDGTPDVFVTHRNFTGATVWYNYTAPSIEGPTALDTAEDTPLDIDFSIVNPLTESVTFAVSANRSEISDGGLTYTPPADFAGNATLTYVVTGSQASFTHTIAVTITAVDDPAQITVPSGISTLEDQAVSIEGVSVTDVDGGDLSISYSSDHGTVNTDSGLVLTPNQDFNGEAIIHLTVGAAASSIRIDVIPVDDPTIITVNTTRNAIEDQPHRIDDLVVTDPDDEPLNLVFTATNGEIQFDGDTPVFVPQGDFVGEAIVTINDIVLTITVAEAGDVDVNDPPSLAIENLIALAEFADRVPYSDTPIKIADIAIQDNVLGTNTLSVDNPDFEVQGNEFYLSAGVVLDFETQPQFTVTVSVDAPTVGFSPDDSATVTLQIRDVNESPRMPVVTFYVPAGDTQIAQLVADAPDNNEVLTFSTTDPRFAISATGVVTTVALQQSLQIRSFSRWYTSRRWRWGEAVRSSATAFSSSTR
jgi:hypothetical protein